VRRAGEQSDDSRVGLLVSGSDEQELNQPGGASMLRQDVVVPPERVSHQPASAAGITRPTFRCWSELYSCATSMQARNTVRGVVESSGFCMGTRGRENIRELRTYLSRAAIMCEKDWITARVPARRIWKRSEGPAIFRQSSSRSEHVLCDGSACFNPANAGCNRNTKTLPRNASSSA